MNTKLMSLGLSIVAVLMLTACSKDSTSDSPAGGGGSIVDPIVPYTCEGTIDQGGMSYTTKMGADGELKVICHSGAGGLAFIDGVNELSIAQVISVNTFNSASNDGNTINYTVTTDSLAGTETFKGTTPMGDIECVNTYDTSSLPNTIHDAYDIYDFINFENMVQTDTNCPEWINSDDDNDDEFEAISPQTQLNATIKNTNGTVSHISSYTSIENGDDHDSGTNTDTTGGTTGTNTDTTGGTTGTVSHVDPIVPYTCEGTFDQGASKMGADGELTINCQSGPGSITFAGSINELSIAQVLHINTVNAVTTDGSTINVTITTDSLAGTETFKGTTSTYGDVDCVNTYDTSSLPGTISNGYDIYYYMYIGDMQQIATNCPDWVNDKDDGIFKIRSAQNQSNITITATNGTVSHVSQSISY